MEAIQNKELKIKEIANKNLPIGISKGIIKTESESINYYLDHKEKSKVTYIFFPGAYNRKKGTIQFQRHSWSPSFNGNVLIFDDPTINDSNTLSLGWFQGSGNGPIFKSLVEIIKNFSSSLKTSLDETIIFGSSAGGFVSLKISEELTEPNIVCINPQTEILKYSKNHVEKMLRYSYGIENIDSVNNELDLKHLSVSINQERKGNIHYFQNTHDITHYNTHLKLFIENSIKDLEFNRFKYDQEKNLKINKKSINIIEYSDPKLKHSPPDINGTCNFLKYVNLI